MYDSVAYNWLKLLHGYAPVLSNQASLAEKVGMVEKRTNTPRIRFEHPARLPFLEVLVPGEGGLPKSILLLGTAGDGKTSLMIEGKEKLTEIAASANQCCETFDAETSEGPRHFIFIYDLSAWRGEDPISESQLALLYRFANAVAGTTSEVFVIAANDGVLHQILQDDLPSDVPESMKDLKRTINKLHSSSRSISTDAEEPAKLRLLNLSLIRSEQIMRECLAAVLDRAEWNDPEFGNGTGLMSPGSPVIRNFSLMRSPEVRGRLITLAKLADAYGFHLSIRDVLCLIVNALLGHPGARGGVLSPNAKGDSLAINQPNDAPLHKLLFGEALPVSSRDARMCYVFLSLLQIGKETTNELDDLLIFGGIEQEDAELKEQFETFVAHDPLKQRNQTLSSQARQYVTGDMTDEECLALREVLISERRRLFLNSNDDAFNQLKLWKCTAFHHAGLYLEGLLDALRDGKKPQPSLVRRIVGGLNRIWTGFLLNEDADTLYLCTGLDVTTSPVSDLILGQVEIDGFNGDAIKVELDDATKLPILVFDLPARQKAFHFTLTLQRFEFLIRVANGAMPTSFSRESTEDFAVLKQRCIRDLCNSGSESLHSVNVDDSGRMIRTVIHLHSTAEPAI